MSRTLPNDKWRPSLGLVVLGMLAVAGCLPLLGLSFVRLYENQLVRQAEAELSGQGAAIAAMVARDVEAETDRAAILGSEAPEPSLPPYEPLLDLTLDPLLPSRPDAVPATEPAVPAMAAIGARLSPILRQVRTTSLAGFRITDRNGTVVAGGNEVGSSLAGVDEVATALKGSFRAVMRERKSHLSQPPLYSLSRGTGVRVFTATPILVDGRVAGVVLASRTPNNLMRLVYAERGKVALALATVLAATLGIAFLFVRLVGHPIRRLVERAAVVGRGGTPVEGRKAHYGTREVAQLAASQDAMARRLRERSDYVANFAAHVSHELKTPLTAIQGAAELLMDDREDAPDAMSPGERRRFLGNIVADSVRLGALLKRLRELSKAEIAEMGGSTTLEDVAGQLRFRFPGLAVASDGDDETPVAISAENAGIVFGHLADNAARHGATRLILTAAGSASSLTVRVSDDGKGIPDHERERVFEPFYTTRRESGGTGMGLGIVRALLTTQGGYIEALPSDGGACFLVTLPVGMSRRAA